MIFSLIIIRSKCAAAAFISSPSGRSHMQRFRMSPIQYPLPIARPPSLTQSLSMSTVVSLPPAYSSQIGTQFEYPLQPIYESPYQAASLAAGELDKIINDPVATEENNNEEVQHFHHPQDYSAVRDPVQPLRLSQLVNTASLPSPSQSHSKASISRGLNT